MFSSLFNFNFLNPAWQTAVFWLWAVTAFGGAVVVAGSLMSSVIQYFVSDAMEKVAQKDRKISAQRLGELGTEAATAKRDAAIANLELARIRAPRSINQPQADDFVAKLKPYAGTEFDLSSVNDRETIILAKSILRILRQAGWIQKDWKQQGLFPPAWRDAAENPVCGIFEASDITIDVPLSVEQKYSTTATVFRDALQSYGIPTTATLGAFSINTNTDIVHVVVGRKSL